MHVMTFVRDIIIFYVILSAASTVYIYSLRSIDRFEKRLVDQGDAVSAYSRFKLPTSVAEWILLGRYLTLINVANNKLCLSLITL